MASLELKGFGLPNDFRAHAASDSVKLPSRIIEVRVGDVTGGAVVTVTNSQGIDVVFNNVVVGSTLKIPQAKFIKATGTTAASFVILYWRG